MKPYLLALLGTCADQYYECDVYPKEGDFTHARYLKMAIGGCPVNAAAVAAAKNCDVKVLEMLGADDDTTPFLLSELKRLKIDQGEIFVEKGVTNSRVLILINGNKRTMFVINPLRPPYTVDEKMQDLLNNAAYIYSLLHIVLRSFSTTEPLLKARKHGAKIVFDGSSLYDDESRIRLLYALADGLFINKESYQRLLEHSAADPKELIFAQGGEFIVITDGEKGSTLYLKDRQIHKAALKGIEVIDSTGAGDSFAGAFLSALMSGYDHEKALSLAAVNGAYACTRFGGTGGACDFATLFNFAKEHNYEL